MLTVTLVIRAIPGKGDELAALWEGLATQVLAEEPGCTTFHVSRDISDPDNFTVFEVYDSQESFDIHHNNTARMEEIGPKLVALRQAPVQRVIGRLLI